MSEDLVKVYIYEAEYECPYDWEWDDRPYSTVGQMLTFSEERAAMIPRAQYERWKAAREAFAQVQADIDTIKGGEA